MFGLLLSFTILKCPWAVLVCDLSFLQSKSALSLCLHKQTNKQKRASPQTTQIWKLNYKSPLLERPWHNINLIICNQCRRQEESKWASTGNEGHDSSPPRLLRAHLTAGCSCVTATCSFQMTQPAPARSLLWQPWLSQVSPGLTCMP